MRVTDRDHHAAANLEQVRLLREVLAEMAAPALEGEEAVPLNVLPCGAEPDAPGLE